MVLYRTDDFSKSRTTDITQVLMYELFDRENDQLLENLLSISLDDAWKEEMYRSYKNLTIKLDKSEQLEFVSELIENWNKYTGKNFKHAIWLYPLENVQFYIEFYAMDDMLPMIFGYETSDTSVIQYEGEGTLFFYEELPSVKERV